MKKILVGLDLSPVTPHVVKYAAELAREQSASLILYHAVGIPADLPAVAYSMKPNELESWLVRDATERLEKLRKDLPTDLDATIRVEVRKPWRGIIDAGKEAEVDLILLGRHGYTGFEKLMGTTARRVVEHADRPVLVVPPTER